MLCSLENYYCLFLYSLGLLSPRQAVYSDGDSVPDALLIGELLLSLYSSGLLSPRQAVYPDGDSVPDALLIGELLLALLLRQRAGQHDPGFHRN
jgi:hypothetical protein